MDDKTRELVTTNKPKADEIAKKLNFAIERLSEQFNEKCFAIQLAIKETALDCAIESSTLAAERDKLKEINEELLEALQLMLEQFTKVPSTLKDSEARGKAHAAIAKAKE